MCCTLDCNLFEISITYSFEDIKAIHLLCQQPPPQLIGTLSAFSLPPLSVVLVDENESTADS